METVKITPIAELCPYTKAAKIKIRVCRIWKSSISTTNNAVEASASDFDYEPVASKIDAGSCYEIMKFHFNMLYPRLNRDDILTNVIGHITAVHQLESKQINQRVAQKCDIRIENIRLLFSLTVAILIVNIIFSVRRIVCYIVGRYCRSFLFSIDPEVVFANYYCINKFKSQDLPRYKVNLILEDNTNEISALIIGKAGEKLFGMPCKDLVLNQRLIDQQQLPNEFLRLIGQKKIFHLRFGNRKNSFNSSDVLVYNVSDDTAIEPITPHILPRAVTISSTTVSSSTSLPETSGESHKRKRESVRKALFTGSEQSISLCFKTRSNARV
ncbi:unnamed protein product [Malus baccata var. baccata]